MLCDYTGFSAFCYSYSPQIRANRRSQCCRDFQGSKVGQLRCGITQPNRALADGMQDSLRLHSRLIGSATGEGSKMAPNYHVQQPAVPINDVNKLESIVAKALDVIHSTSERFARDLMEHFYV